MRRVTHQRLPAEQGAQEVSTQEGLVVVVVLSHGQQLLARKFPLAELLPADRTLLDLKKHPEGTSAVRQNQQSGRVVSLADRL